MFDFKGMFSALAAMVAFVCGIVTASALAITGNWWGLAAIPAFPIIAVMVLKLIDRDL